MTTRANLEAILVKRAGPLMTKAGKAVTVVGSNADLNDPIGWGIRKAGYTVSDVSSVSDSDVSGVDSDDMDEVIDLAEYRLLDNILGNLDDVDVKLGPRDEKLSQLAAQVEKKLERIAKGLARDYGYGVGEIETGVLAHDFAEHYSE